MFVPNDLILLEFQLIVYFYFATFLRPLFFDLVRCQFFLPDLPFFHVILYFLPNYKIQKVKVNSRYQKYLSKFIVANLARFSYFRHVQIGNLAKKVKKSDTNSTRIQKDMWVAIMIKCTIMWPREIGYLTDSKKK